MTNDKKLNEALLHPTKQHRKTYIVQVDGDITDKAIKLISQGVEITLTNGKYTTKPCNVRKLYKAPVLPERNPPVRFRQNIPTSWAVIEITEGKNRQVRKMFAKVGFPVLRLVRMQIEGLKLGKLEPGKYYSIEKKELLQLLNIDYSKSTPKKTVVSKIVKPSGLPTTRRSLSKAQKAAKMIKPDSATKRKKR